MNEAEFLSAAAEARSRHPRWFDGSDPLATAAKIEAAERALGVVFPREYRWFLEQFGGGYFAFTNVFSVEPESDWYVGRRQVSGALAAPRFLAVSDDEAGGLNGFIVEPDGMCQSGVHYLYFSGDEDKPVPRYPNLLDFLAVEGLKLSPQSIR